MNRIITERLHLFTPNIYIGIRVTLEGKLDKQIIETAIDQVITHVEVLHKKIVIAKSKGQFDLLILAHHLVGDGISIEILMDMLLKSIAEQVLQPNYRNYS